MHRLSGFEDMMQACLSEIAGANDEHAQLLTSCLLNVSMNKVS